MRYFWILAIFLLVLLLTPKALWSRFTKKYRRLRLVVLTIVAGSMVSSYCLWVKAERLVLTRRIEAGIDAVDPSEPSELRHWKQELMNRDEFAFTEFLTAKEIERRLTELWKEDEAIAVKEIPTLDPNQYGRALPCAYQSLGELYYLAGKRSQAASIFIKAADLSDGVAKASYLAGLKCFDAGDLENAAVYLDKAFAMDTQIEQERGECKVFQGYIHLMQRRYDEAENMFREAMHEHKGVAWSLFEILHFMVAGFSEAFIQKPNHDFAVAKRKFMEMFFSGSGNYLSVSQLGALVGMGHLAIIQKDYRSAQEYLNTAWSGREPYVPLEGLERASSLAHKLIYKMYNLGMGWANANQNIHDEAIKYFELALETNSDDALALLGLGNSLIGLDRLKEAEEVLARILVLEPGNQYALAGMGTIRYGRGEDIQAEQAFKKALTQDAGYACPYEGLGLLYLRQGKNGAAKAFFEKAIDINPDIEYKKFNGLARIFMKEGNYDRAERLLRKSLENYPYENEATELLKDLDDMRREKRQEVGKDRMLSTEALLPGKNDRPVRQQFHQDSPFAFE